MSKRMKIASIAFTGAATMLAAGPATAAPVSWHVKNGAAGFKGAVKAKARAGTRPHFKNVTTGFTVQCSSGSLSLSIAKSNSAAASAKLGKLKKTPAPWKTCGGLFPFVPALTTSPTLVAQKFNSGLMTGKLSGNKISIQLKGGPNAKCKSVTLSGTSLPIEFVNARHSLSINRNHVPTLTVKKTSGNCFMFNVGNKVSATGSYHVSVPASLKFIRS